MASSYSSVYPFQHWHIWPTLASKYGVIIRCVTSLSSRARLNICEQADKAFGAQHGCQPMAVRLPTKWPLGLDVLKAQYLANVDQHLLAFQEPHIKNLGLNFSVMLLGAETYTTLDLENLETVLSSKFEGMRLL